MDLNNLVYILIGFGLSQLGIYINDKRKESTKRKNYLKALRIELINNAELLTKKEYASSYPTLPTKVYEDYINSGSFSNYNVLEKVTMAYNSIYALNSIAFEVVYKEHGHGSFADRYTKSRGDVFNKVSDAIIELEKTKGLNIPKEEKYTKSKQ